MRIAFTANDPANAHLQTRRFRTALEAFGYPARLFKMDGPARLALLECLCDSDTPVALEAGACALAPEQSARLIPLVTRAKAEFLFADAQGFVWDNLPLGTTEAPEGGATILLEVAELSTDQGACRARAEGAGTTEETTFYLDQDSAATLARRPSYPYPTGVDLILTSGATFLALPRHLSWRIG